MHRLRHSINATIPMPASQPDSWLEQAACRGRDPELFFSDKADDKAAAKAICDGCPVRKTCLAGAIERREQHGICGGRDFALEPATGRKSHCKKGHPFAAHAVIDENGWRRCGECQRVKDAAKSRIRHARAAA